MTMLDRIDQKALELFYNSESSGHARPILSAPERFRVIEWSRKDGEVFDSVVIEDVITGGMYIWPGREPWLKYERDGEGGYRRVE